MDCGGAGWRVIPRACALRLAGSRRNPACVQNFAPFELSDVRRLEREHANSLAIAGHKLHFKLSAFAPYIHDGADIACLQAVFWKAVYQHDDLMFSRCHKADYINFTPNLAVTLNQFSLFLANSIRSCAKRSELPRW